ncbi:hypothetical protein JCM8547_008067 [Rhodosporidiobolus lusitaniae]
MLDRLPPELVDHVLASISPKWSRKTLLACCLVESSISVRAFALLWRDLGWGDSQNANLLAVLEDQRTHGTRVRSLRVYGQNLLPFVKQMPRLKELSLTVCHGADVEAVAEAVPELETLRLMTTWSLALRPSLSFPALTSFTVENVDLPPSIFTPSVFPSLRTFSYSGPEKKHTPEAYSTIFPPGPGSLIQQLDMLQLDIQAVLDYGNQGASPRGSSPRAPPAAAFNGVADDDDNVDGQEDVEVNEYYLGVVRHLVHLVEQASLASLHLPHMPTDLVSARKTIKRLLETCEKKGVEVVYFDQKQEPEDSFSWPFWRYAKQLKARRVEGV